MLMIAETPKNITLTFTREGAFYQSEWINRHKGLIGKFTCFFCFESPFSFDLAVHTLRGYTFDISSFLHKLTDDAVPFAQRSAEIN